MSRAVVEVGGREGTGRAPTTHAPFQRLSFRPHIPAVRVSHTETRTVTKVLAKYGTSITAASLGARALFTTGVGQLKQARVTVWVWVNTACRMEAMRGGRCEDWGRRG